MSVKIGSNIASFQAQRRLSEATTSVQGSVERLSSGLRINKAADDSAGLAISSQLSANTKVYSQAIRNANDGISLLSIADSAVQSLTDIATRIKELAAQASNGSYTVTQRGSLDQEAQALKAEYLRIVQSTKFNNVNLLDGSLGSGASLQLGYGDGNSILASVGGKIGTGTFQLVSTQTLYLSNNDQVSGDMNRDGYLDIIMTQGTGFGVQFGNGNGTFAQILTASIYSMEASGTSEIKVADVNNDGHLDVLTTGTGAGTGRLTVRLNNGDGTFGAAVSYQAQTTNSASLSVGDINSDGKVDVVTYGSSGGAGTAVVFLGNGDGTFTNQVSYSLDATASDIELGDINSDGKLDIVSLGNTGVNSNITTRLGNGDGTFGAAITNVIVSTGTSNYEIKLADFNSDGVLDVGAAAGTSVYIRTGSNNGYFTGSGSYSFAVCGVSEVAFGDINGDGFIDMAASGGTAYTRLGSGDGTFSSVTTLSSISQANNMSLADYNNDGVLDISFSNNFVSGVTLGLSKDGSAPLLSFSLKTKSDALQALTDMTNKLNQLGQQSGTIGGALSRLSYAVNNLGNLKDNLSAANARITDIDVAEETGKLLRNQILQDASTAILAQANQQPALALSLLS